MTDKGTNDATTQSKEYLPDEIAPNGSFQQIASLTLSRPDRDLHQAKHTMGWQFISKEIQAMHNCHFKNLQ